MSPHKFGIPQQRERVYFICVRKDIYKQPVELIEPETDIINFNDYLDKKDTIDPKYFINGDILDVLKTKNDNSYVIFESCVLECILDVKKMQKIKSEINRVSVKSFHVRIQPSILMLSNTMTKSLERYTFN